MTAIDPDLYNKPFGFVIRNESWHHTAGSVDHHERYVTEEIMIGQYDRLGALGGLTALGEFAIRWIPLNNLSAPRLESFDDSWAAFAHPQIQKLIAWMAARGSNVAGARVDGTETALSPASVIAGLRDLGFIDWTARTPPDEDKAEWTRNHAEATRILGEPREEALRRITLLLSRIRALEQQVQGASVGGLIITANSGAPDAS